MPTAAADPDALPVASLRLALERITRVFAWGGLAYLPMLLWRCGECGRCGPINSIAIACIACWVLLAWQGARLPLHLRALALLFSTSLPHVVTSLFYQPWPGNYAWILATVLCGTLFYGIRKGLFFTLPPALALCTFALLHGLDLLPDRPPAGMTLPTPLQRAVFNLGLSAISLWVAVTVTRLHSRALLSSLERFRTLFDGVQEAVLLLKPDGEILDFNPSALTLFQARPEELRGRPFPSLADAGEAGTSPLQPALARGLREGPLAFLGRLASVRDERRFWASLSLRPLEIGESPCLLASVHDIDELVRSRERIQAHLEEVSRLNEGLERRVAERTASLEHANEELRTTLDDLVSAQERLREQERIASLSGMVVGMAHELNTPLGNVLSCNDLLLKEAASIARAATLEEATRSAARLESTGILLGKAARQAAQLVRQFKQVAVPGREAPLNRIRLRAFLESQRIQLQPRLQERGVQLGIDCPEELELEGHPSALAQVLGQLTDNALLHGCQEERRLDWIVAETPEALRIAVRDYGPGMPAESLKRLFEPFFTTLRARGGLGLGAHVAWNLATAVLQGTLEARNAAPGLEVSLRLPKR